jgi:hypothetical protein
LTVEGAALDPAPLADTTSAAAVSGATAAAKRLGVRTTASLSRAWSPAVWKGAAVGSRDADALFEQLVARFADEPDVTPPTGGTGFGASGLKVGGKLFAMLNAGELVVKLPRDRVDDLIAAGAGTRFDPGHGRLMKEWVTIDAERGDEWPGLADEARGFVAGAGSRRR